MMFLIAVIAALLSVGLVYTAYAMQVKTSKTEQPARFAPFDLEEMMELKEYAELFGVSNETIDDASKLLHLGRKAEGLLGKERVAEIAQASREYHNCAPTMNVLFETNEISHAVTSMVKTSELIICNTFVVMSHVRGGDRSDEEQANRRTAA
jgi:leucyl aminopeptidase (aminopeptidase T)